MGKEKIHRCICRCSRCSLYGGSSHDHERLSNLRADMWGNGYTVEAIQALIEHINSIRPIRVIEGGAM